MKVLERYRAYIERNRARTYAVQHPASYSGIVHMVRSLESKQTGAPISLLEDRTDLFPSELQQRLKTLQEAGLIMVQGEEVRITPSKDKHLSYTKLS